MLHILFFKLFVLEHFSVSGLKALTLVRSGLVCGPQGSSNLAVFFLF